MALVPFDITADEDTDMYSGSMEGVDTVLLLSGQKLSDS